jgi:hypothetical protein
MITAFVTIPLRANGSAIGSICMVLTPKGGRSRRKYRIGAALHILFSIEIGTEWL